MFERFTHAARDVVIGAQAQARDLQQSPIGTEHLLLALLADPAGPIATIPALTDRQIDARAVRAEVLRLTGPDPRPAAAAADTDAEDAAALRAIGIDLAAVRKAIEDNFGPGTLRLLPEEPPKRRGLLRRGNRGHIPFSARAKKVLELSLREAIRLKQNFIAPEHLMLGILREGRGLAVKILTDAKVDPARLGEDLTRSLQNRVA